MRQLQESWKGPKVLLELSSWSQQMQVCLTYFISITLVFQYIVNVGTLPTWHLWTSEAYSVCFLILQVESRHFSWKTTLSSWKTMLSSVNRKNPSTSIIQGYGLRAVLIRLWCKLKILSADLEIQTIVLFPLKMSSLWSSPRDAIQIIECDGSQNEESFWVKFPGCLAKVSHCVQQTKQNRISGYKA